MLKGNKKGANIDSIFTIVIFFGLALFFVTMMLAWNALNSGMDSIWEGSSIGQDIKQDTQDVVNQFDWMILTAWIALHLGILAVAFLLRTHPAMLIVAILLTTIITIVAVPLSNAYQDMALDEELSTAITAMPMSNFILTYLPKLEMIWAFVTIIVTFGMAKSEGYL